MTAFPDIKHTPITSDTEFVILACDGIWDVMTSQVALNYLHTQCYGNKVDERQKRPMGDLVKGIEACLDECCAKDLHSC